MSAGVIASHQVLGGPPGFGTIGAKAVFGASTVDVPYPSSPGAGDLAVAALNGWYSNIVISNEAGWSSAEQSGGTGTSADSHSGRMKAFWAELSGSESGNAQFDIATVNSGIGVMARYVKLAGTSWSIQSTSGTDDVHGADRAVTAIGTLDLRPDDRVVVCISTDTDTQIVSSTISVSASGITFGSTARRSTSLVGTPGGSDGNVDIFDVLVTSGSGTVTPSFSWTTAITQCGPVVFLRLRSE